MTPLAQELSLRQFSLFYSPCTCLSAHLWFKPNSREASLYSVLTKFRGIFSTVNTEKKPRGSPLRERYGCLLWVHNSIRALFILCFVGNHVINIQPIRVIFDRDMVRAYGIHITEILIRILFI